MAQTVADVMTTDPVTIEASESVTEAARRMSTADSGAIIVLDNGRVTGMITDRDIAIRVVAEGRDVATTTTGEAASQDELVTVAPDTSLQQAVQLMRSKAVRRLPVVQDDRAVGILSIGDLAVELDETSALADVSAAESNT
ncbi:MAG: CBS domain-containing protein [Actinomycetota bacterium]|nr:CBS domain-containing protein [Actinomycetota bacterium]